MEAWVINSAGFVLILAIIWWFWLHKQKAISTASQKIVEIIVENGVYTPATIKTVAGKTLTLRFIRKDPSHCSDVVIFANFNIHAELDVDSATEVVLRPTAPGEYPFTCEMGMYQGLLIVTPGCH